MKLKILGCSGGIGKDLRTTTTLLDDDVLIDAGTGVGDLTIAEMARIEHIFVTHAHLDHVCSIPFLLDTVGHMRASPITVYAIKETLDTLRAHLFNNALWPDFSRLPTVQSPYLKYQEIKQGETTSLAGRRITALPANHIVPASDYWLDSGAASLILTGDTGPNPALWNIANTIDNLRYLIIETAFCNREHKLALAAKHLNPHLLLQELQQLSRPVTLFITHLKPADRETTMQEIMDIAAEYQPKMLEQGQIIEF